MVFRVMTFHQECFNFNAKCVFSKGNYGKPHKKKVLLLMAVGKLEWQKVHKQFFFLNDPVFIPPPTPLNGPAIKRRTKDGRNQKSIIKGCRMPPPPTGSFSFHSYILFEIINYIPFRNLQKGTAYIHHFRCLNLMSNSCL